MKKLIFGTVMVAAMAVCGMTGYRSLSPEAGENLSALTMANVEALSQYEGDLDKCKGCSTSYSGSFCCVMVVNGGKFYLYHRGYLI